MTKLLDIRKATTSMLITDFVDLVTQLIEAVQSLYGVGKIFMSLNETNPGDFIGGNWEHIEARMLFSSGNVESGEAFALGKTGGTVTHRHLTSIGFDGAQLFGFQDSQGNPFYGSEYHEHKKFVNFAKTWQEGDAPIRIAYTAHEWHMPPYLVVNMWKRTS